MSDLGKSPNLERRIEPFALIDRDGLERETVVQNMRRHLKSIIIPIVGIGVVVAVPAAAIYPVLKRDMAMAVQDQEFDEKQERALESFGSQGEVVQILGKHDFISENRRYELWQCVVKNSEGIKLVVSFDNDLPVVVGETWEMKYLADKNIFILSQQVEKQKEL